MTAHNDEKFSVIAPAGTFRAVESVVAERARQERKGWTVEHDDEHGIDHLVIEANRRHHQRLGNGPRAFVAPELYRQWLVENAALYVAAIEALDRNVSGSSVGEPTSNQEADHG